MQQACLTGKVSVVTGGSRGIGKYIAAALHHAGATVAITGRDADTLRAAAETIGERCRAYVCDQRDPAAIRAMATEAIEAMGVPDILVNNAGVYRGGQVVGLSLDRWNDIIATNLTGVFVTTQAFLRAMLKKEHGDIFMISSTSGKKGDPGTAAYSASKFGLQGFSQALMHEVRGRNIRVMVLNPSSVDLGEDDGPKHGPGLFLHAADLAQPSCISHAYQDEH